MVKAVVQFTGNWSRNGKSWTVDHSEIVDCANKPLGFVVPDVMEVRGMRGGDRFFKFERAEKIHGEIGAYHYVECGTGGGSEKLCVFND